MRTSYPMFTQAGRIFYATYPELHSYSLPYEDQSRYLCAPWILLHSRTSERRLYPIAIQLYQKPGPEVPIYTPSDCSTQDGPYTDWLIAKMWAKVH